MSTVERFADLVWSCHKASLSETISLTFSFSVVGYAMGVSLSIDVCGSSFIIHWVVGDHLSRRYHLHVDSWSGLIVVNILPDLICAYWGPLTWIEFGTTVVL